MLSNSVYPEHFQVTHEFEFEQSAAELRLRVLIPGPTEISDIKAYKYLMSTESRGVQQGSADAGAVRSFVGP